ncbi:tail fiber protein [Escherichia phage EP335]|uniref:Putative tail fiber protein n=1 Tax=Escherichia phage EP335 TaxID=2070199 RepID=A0A2Z3DSF1_9CAUD|nr:tail fiber protein [Escherichia phage EP335]AVZ45096.1 putative tail fiber protein [Escherichia phage EP335]
MSRELMPKSGIMMPHVVINRDAAVVGVSTVDGVAGAVNLTDKYLQKTDAASTYLTRAEGATKTFVTDAIGPIMSGALFKDDPVVANDVAFRSGGANGVESVDMIKVTPENTIKLGSYASSVQGVEIHSAGRLQVVDQNDSGVETKYPVYSKRYRPEIEDLPFAAIGSYVKDSKGRTIGVTRTGINSDIKQLTQKVTFTQPVTVADGVGDYDAVTMRQLRNSGGGSGGPTMSGISNFGIGDFHLRDSRAFIPAFEVVSDGQLLNRADYPDLWAYAQLLTPISDAAWLADAQQRGKYSTGDGTTTFRVPDRNGVQAGSLKELFARGDGGNSSNNGMMYDAALPNIVGYTAHTLLTASSSQGQVATDGAFTSTTSTQGVWPVSGGGGLYTNIRFDANQSDPTYGRYGITSNVIPRNFIGVWTIRAHGGFTAANTSWSVIDSDSTEPASGTVVRGGSVKSEYKIGTSPKYQAYLQAYGKIGGLAIDRGAVLSNGVQEWFFNQDGTLYFPDAETQIGTLRSDGALHISAYVRPKDVVVNPLNSVGVAASERNAVRMINYANVPEGGYINSVGGDWYDGNWMLGGVRSGTTALDRAQLNILNGIGSSASYIFGSDGIARCQEWRSTSDERIKSNIERISDPLSKMKNIKGVTWVLETNGSVGYGFIAQDVEKDFPEAVSEIKASPVTLRDGSVLDNVKSVNTSGVAAALHHEAILELMKQVEDLKKEVSELKSSK